MEGFFVLIVICVYEKDLIWFWFFVF